MKKLLALFLCVFLALETVPMYAFAAEPSDAKLEEAIREVKSKIDIPSSYSKFEYNFNTPDSYNEPYWRFSWTNSEGAVIEVNCDEKNHIIFYRNENNMTNDSAPKYLKSELKSTADDFIKKIAPEITSELSYINSSDTNVYDGGYQYYYQRQINGIPFPDNYITVNVNKSSGKVISSSVCWLYDVAVPTSKTELTKEDATKKIKNSLTMNLSYLSDYSYYYDKANKKEKAYLVYQPDKQYIAVDANSGKIYTKKYESIYSGNELNAATAADTNYKSTTSVQLTESEIAEIKTLKELITKDAAIKAVKNNKYLFLDKNLKKTKATLKKVSNGQDKDTYIWDIEMSDPRKVKDNENSYRAYANAQVNAKSGKILYFNASLAYNFNDFNWKNVKVKYNKKTCQKTVETFLKKEVPEKYNNTKLSSVINDYAAYYSKNHKPVYRGFDYIYNRVNEGVEFPFNTIDGSVDALTGKIYSYRISWSDNVVFESSNGIMSENQAKDSYLSKDGYQLEYDIYQTNQYSDKETDSKIDYQVRLVYSTNINPIYISPFTGNQLNYDGTVYTKTKPFTYVDIDNSELYRSVYLLSDMNVGFEGDHFYPNKEITLGEMDSLLSSFGYGSVSDLEEMNSSKLITREEMACYFIKSLGLEKVSQIQGIYTTGYNDQSSIDSRYVGAVALAKGLGIISGDTNNNFNPKKNVTRLETANMLMYFIKLKNDGI